MSPDSYSAKPDDEMLPPDPMDSMGLKQFYAVSDPEKTVVDALSTPLPPLDSGEAEETPLSMWHIQRDWGHEREETPLPPDTTLPSGDLNPQYILGRMIGRGGIGEIWEAKQTSLGRIVAVKRLRPEVLKPSGRKTDDTKTRAYEQLFRLEALNAGRLEHPNIVPVYDLGIDSDGSPLMAMKLVRGRSWQRIIDEEFGETIATEFLARHLPILVDVAHAVAYAHSRCIIHRDLKPSQVMIGDYGEVMLMDWGLAMKFDPDLRRRADLSPATPEPEARAASAAQGQSLPSGTPAYMAPEQTYPEKERLGPWTDVYLLGGILYTMLTGKPPHDGKKTRDAFLQARRGIVRPFAESAPDREIPPELGRLCLGALAPEPIDRPASVQAFIAALQDYQTGASRRRESQELVEEVRLGMDLITSSYADAATAINQLEQARLLWPENPGVEPLRQRLLFTYANAALANDDLVLASVQAESLADGEERRFLLQRIAKLAKEKEERAEMLEGALRQAREERARAEDLMSFMMRDLHKALKTMGRLELLEQIANKSVDYYESLPKSGPDGETLVKRAQALENIGEVLEDRGNLRQALRTYQDLRDLAKCGVGNNPGSEVWQSQLAGACARMGQVLYEQRNLDEALTAHCEALALRQALAHAHPEDPRAHDELASIHSKLGSVYWRIGDLRKSLNHHRSAINLLERLSEEYPEVPEWSDHLAGALNAIAVTYTSSELLEEAAQAYTRSILLRQSLARREPDNMPMLRGLAWSFSSLGHLKARLGDYGEAEEFYQASRRILDDLVEKDLRNDRLQRELAWLLGSMAEMRRCQGKTAEGIQLAQTAVAMQRRLAQEHPTFMSLRYELGWATHLLGQLLTEEGIYDEALKTFQQAWVLRLETLEKRPKEHRNRYYVHETEVQMGRLLAKQGRIADARNYWLRAVRELAPEVQSQDPPNRVAVDVLIQAHLLLDQIGEAQKLLRPLLTLGHQNPDLWNLVSEKDAMPADTEPPGPDDELQFPFNKW
ncbi:MAG: protein kinase [Sumerlaeia bacterium]